MILLDLFCGAGGATKGYQRVGFFVVGVDINPQPHYCGDAFVRMDALEALRILIAGGFIIDDHGYRWYLKDFDAIHSSPPCQAYSVMTNGRWQDRVEEHPDLIAPVRTLLIKTGVPFVIENVSGARGKLINPILLCGTMFGLQSEAGNQLFRHRYFECSWGFAFTPPCRHEKGSAIGVYGGGQNPARRKRRTKLDCTDIDFGIKARGEAMGIDWMVGLELNEAIPPAYTEFIGKHLIEYIRRQVEEG